MLLAGILALCALLRVPASGDMGSGPSPLAIADAHSIRHQSSGQEPAKSEPPAEAAPAQDQPKPPSPQPPQQPAQTQENPQAPSAGAPPENTTPEKKKPEAPQGSASPAPHKLAKKKSPAPSPTQDQKHKVVSHGSTKDPITQLSPQMSDQQAARQRAVTDQLLASTDASLQRLSGRTLSQDQQDTVTQIRKFMEQVKAAEAAGDLQRAYKLAVKAHLLADALEKS